MIPVGTGSLCFERVSKRAVLRDRALCHKCDTVRIVRSILEQAMPMHGSSWELVRIIKLVYYVDRKMVSFLGFDEWSRKRSASKRD